MKFTILTQFPEMFMPVIKESILGKAAEKGLLSFDIVNIRNFTKDKHNRTDDTPFGGGAGMTMSPQPAFDALDSVSAKEKRCIYLSPRGKMLCKSMAQDLSEEDEVVLLCGHYEGVDQRILDAYNFEEVSIGDYILTGGELAAMVLIDTTARLVPGVLGNELSPMDESVYSGLLEADQYTKPREYEGMQVPEVLFGGNHKLIHLWQFERSLALTKERRPDLFKRYIDSNPSLTKDEVKVLKKVLSEDNDQ